MKKQLTRLKYTIKNRITSLRDVWTYSDSQPTEITLALVNVILAPVATYLELGPLWLFQIFLVFCGLYQLYCISVGDLECRIRASFITFSAYFATLLTYVYCIGLPTPTHWGWLVLTVSAFGSLRRLTKEKLAR